MVLYAVVVSMSFLLHGRQGMRREQCLAHETETYMAETGREGDCNRQKKACSERRACFIGNCMNL